MNDSTHRAPQTRVDSPGAADIERVARTLGGRFSVSRLLRADSSTATYLARDERGGLVEIKTLAAEAARDFRRRELFYLEAYAASRLSHLNIASASRPEEIDGLHFSATEHRPEAETLRDLISRNGWLDTHTAVGIADQVASALDAAHEAGVLHLRLQPEAVLIEPDGWVVVTDFGVEASADPAWAREQRVLPARASYLSPEPPAGAGRGSDLYSLGVILYEMLTDRVPFDSDDEDYVKQRQAHYMPAPPHMLFTEVRKEISDVVMRLLEKNPGSRFADAAALQVAMDIALGPGAASVSV